MAKRVARRFGGDVEKGKMKGSYRVPPKGYLALLGEINNLEEYLSRRLLPQEPEDRKMANLLLILQNLIEYELERLIEVFVRNSPTTEHLNFVRQIQTGFVAFKTKFAWAYARGLVTSGEHDIMEEIRLIRNAQTHVRPDAKRPKHRYRGRQLLTRKSIEQVFKDVNALVLKLRTESGNPDRWEIIPPGYAKEMGWGT
jgi:hypothetical protein